MGSQEVMVDLATIAQISGAIQDRPQLPALVALDGYSGAGKSTLAQTLADHLLASVVQMDDFYRVIDPNVRAALTPAEGVDCYFDWQRLRREVLEPLRRGEAARFQRYDWNVNRLGSWAHLASSGITIVEGVYSARPELADLMDLRVLVDTPRAVRIDRQLVRNESSAAWIARWAAAEDLYFSEILPRNPVDLVVSGQLSDGHTA